MSSDVAAPAGGDDDRTGRIARSDLVVFDDDDVASHLSDDASAISARTMKNSHDEEMYDGSTSRPGGVTREDGSIGRVEVEPSRRTIRMMAQTHHKHTTISQNCDDDGCRR